MKFSLTLWRKLVLLHETMVVVGVVAFGYIANEIVSGAVQSQYTRFLEIRQKAAKLRTNESVEMLLRGLNRRLENLGHAVAAAADSTDCAQAAAAGAGPASLQRAAKHMTRAMLGLRLDAFALLDPTGRTVVRAGHGGAAGDRAYYAAGEPMPHPTADLKGMIDRALAGRLTASFEALPPALLAREPYLRPRWLGGAPPLGDGDAQHFATLADFARIRILGLPNQPPTTDLAWEDRGLAMVVAAPVHDDSDHVCGAAVGYRLLSRSPQALAEHMGVRADIGALYLGRVRVAVAAESPGQAEPLGALLDDAVGKALLAGSVTQAGVEALASTGTLAAYRVLLDSQQRPIAALFARTPTSQFGLEIESERISHQLAQANSYKIIWMTAMTAGLLAFAIIIVNAERVSKPLRELVRLSHAIAAGDLDVRAPEKGSDEVAQLAHSMNLMATGLQQTYRELEQKVEERTRSLELSQARYRHLIESAPNMIHTIDAQGRILSVNALEANTLGYERAELEAMHFRDIVAPDQWPQAEQALRRAFDSPWPQRYETVLRTKTGDDIPVEVTTTIRDEQGDTLQTNILRDITEEKSLQRQLIESERLSAVGEMIAGVAHEIRNPLNTLGITVRNLRDDVARHETRENQREDYNESIDILTSELERLDRLIDDFMRVARIPELVFELCDMRAVVQEIVRVVSGQAQNLGVEIVTEFPDVLVPVSADGELLHQAFLNLVLNGMEAVGRGGRVVVRVEQQHEQTVVSFVDNGCGIAPEHRGRVFDIFFSTKATGTGIGLSLVHRIARAHDGSVTFDTEVGRGTTFRFAIPRRPSS